MPKRAGRPSAAQTPAPKSEKIYGSKKNPKGSATEKKAKSIQLSDKTINTLKEKLDNFKKSHPSKKNITLSDLKAVYRRGSGAYSSSHRPTITGGAPNSRAAWSYARVNKFLKKAGGAKVKAAYVQDDDLMANGGRVLPELTQKELEFLKNWMSKSDSVLRKFMGSDEIKMANILVKKGYMVKGRSDDKQDSVMYYIDLSRKEREMIENNADNIFARGGGIKSKGGDCYEAAGQFCMGSAFMPEPIEFVGEPHLVHAEVKGQGKAEGIRFGHAWVEDDENVYDYSNGRRIVMPKLVYYAIGDIQTENPLKYQRYTFPEARAKMLKTKHYGSWDIETEYADGGLTDGIELKITDGGVMADEGEPSQLVTCINCSWEWETADSAEFDKYVCHQCGFDNSLFYDGGLLKPTMPLDQIAEKHGVDIQYLEEQLNKGLQHEKEHTDSDEVATSIALHHLAERPDYYEELEKLELEDGGELDVVILEDNSPEEYEIVDFLKQQREEAHMVMTCDGSKIYKAMICKTKCEIADKRMAETEDLEEMYAWLHYKNTWNDCLQDILDDNIEMYKAGGKTCGCGCGSIYSKGGLAFANGGLAYGNSHDKGGMPLTVKSTGQNIEIEGGEGVVNKRSMQSTKKVEFQGQKMTPCEAVSKINEMGGGVKFKCNDVKNIIAEDGQF